MQRSLEEGLWGTVLLKRGPPHSLFTSLTCYERRNLQPRIAHRASRKNNLRAVPWRRRFQPGRSRGRQVSSFSTSSRGRLVLHCQFCCLPLWGLSVRNAMSFRSRTRQRLVLRDDGPPPRSSTESASVRQRVIEHSRRGAPAIIAPRRDHASGKPKPIPNSPATASHAAPHRPRRAPIEG